MNLFKKQINSESNARDQILGEEAYEAFLLMVTLISLINKSNYSPVTFLIEYVNNPSLQKIFQDKTGINKYEFVVAFMEEFPSVASSRKLKSNIK